MPKTFAGLWLMKLCLKQMTRSKCLWPRFSTEWVKPMHNLFCHSRTSEILPRFFGHWISWSHHSELTPIGQFCGKSLAFWFEVLCWRIWFIVKFTNLQTSGGIAGFMLADTVVRGSVFSLVPASGHQTGPKPCQPRSFNVCWEGQCSQGFVRTEGDLNIKRFLMSTATNHGQILAVAVEDLGYIMLVVRYALYLWCSALFGDFSQLSFRGQTNQHDMPLRHRIWELNAEWCGILSSLHHTYHLVQGRKACDKTYAKSMSSIEIHTELNRFRNQLYKIVRSKRDMHSWALANSPIFPLPNFTVSGLVPTMAQVTVLSEKVKTRQPSF